MSNPRFLDHNRWLVSTSCHECFIDVEHSDKDDAVRWVSVGLLSTHEGAWNGRFFNRLKMAWRLLWDSVPTAFDLGTAEEVDALQAALSHARINAFGYPPPFIGTAAGFNTAFKSIDIRIPPPPAGAATETA
jgi:hypothetical protein